MKKVTLSKLIFTALSMMVLNDFAAQNTFPTSGFAGVGIGTSPNAHMHLHGTTDYTVANRLGFVSNYGKTSRLLLTNTNTGTNILDGLLIRMSGPNAAIENQESRDLLLVSGGASINFDGLNSRINSGISAGSNTTFAKLNIQTSSDNGMYIRTVYGNKYALRLHVADATTNGIELVNSSNNTQKNFTVNGGGQVKMLVANGTTNALEVANTSDATKKNFTVTGSGQVFARKYTTTLANIPDYVFEADYSLMPLADLDSFIKVNHHLPNIPSAAQYEAEGVDLGEMNRLLLEKVEELTLYVLQLNEEVKLLKENK